MPKRLTTFKKRDNYRRTYVP